MGMVLKQRIEIKGDLTSKKRDVISLPAAIAEKE
jgi:hypothetical protein